MNLNQAKKAAGIDSKQPIAGREAITAAISQAKRQAAKFHPDRNPGDKAAAQSFLAAMTARKYFEKKLPHACPVCQVTIGRGATHCRIHQQGSTKLLAAAVNTEPKRNAKDRVSVEGDPLALHGYYTAPVQKIVSKWRDEIGETKLQSYFESVASPVVFRKCEIQLPLVAPQHWQAVFELGQAICAVMNNTKQPHAWLLRTPGPLPNHPSPESNEADDEKRKPWKSLHVATNGRYLSIAEIRQQIIDAGGPDFTHGNIAQALKGLRLATSDEIAAEWRKSVMKKTG